MLAIISKLSFYPKVRDTGKMEDKLLDEELSRSNAPRKWPLKLFECCEYRDIKGNRMWCPEFCPKAVMCASGLAGRIHTSLIEEDPVCCGMGSEGLCCCIVLIPFSVYTPTGGMGALCLVTNYLRGKTMQKYGVEDNDLCNCSNTCVNSMCNFCCYGFFYPCSLFQMLVSIEYWEQEDILPLGEMDYSNQPILHNFH